MRSKKTHWYNSIVFIISAHFFMVAILVITVCGVGIFAIQTKEYEERSITNMRHIGSMLRDEIAAEGDVFLPYQEYIIEHSLEIKIPHDFDEFYVDEAKEEFERLFEATYPDKIFRRDIGFNGLTDDLKKAFCRYYHARWFLYFEQMRAWYDLPYVYYVHPSGEGHHVLYIFDTERLFEGDESEGILHICDDYEEDYDEMPFLFDTWNAGVALDGMDSFDNEYGRTYSYYVPLYIDNKKLGLVCVDMDIDYVHSSTFRNVKRLVLLSGITLFAGLAVAFSVNRRFALKLTKIKGYVEEYSRDKDVAVAGVMERSVKGKDEVASLGNEIAGMMRSLDEYMKNLDRTEEALEQSRKSAMRDALTDVRNKLAYDEAMKQEQWGIDNGLTDIGIIMIDLNYLKKINDNYGHEKGNISIKVLCNVVCNTFKRSPVFRIGGDEFVVILRGDDFESRDILVKSFDQQLEALEGDPALQPWEKVSAALGLAVYDERLDSDITSVFKRADVAMYEKKKAMKASGKA